MTDKRTVKGKDGNLRYVKPAPLNVSSKKLGKANPEPSSMRDAKKRSEALKVIKSHEDIEAGLKAKIENIFIEAATSPLQDQKLLISKGYKLENLAGEKVVNLNSVIDKKGNIKKWGDLSVLYIHNFLAEGFKVALGKHPKFPEDANKTAIYLKK